jgi:hypothetical protein
VPVHFQEKTMFDVLSGGAHASAMAPRHTPLFPFIGGFFGLVACLASGAVHAQTAGAIRPSVTATQEVLKPETRVPAPAYRSVFASLPQGVENGAVDWRESNTQAGQFPRGHADLLKWEQKNPTGLPVRPPGARP